jgi:hypothetical protein
MCGADYQILEALLTTGQNDGKLTLPIYKSKFILDSFLLHVCPAKFLRSPATNVDFFARLHIL